MFFVSPFIVNKNIINYNTSIIFFQTPVFLTKKIISIICLNLQIMLIIDFDEVKWFNVYKQYMIIEIKKINISYQ